MSEESKVSTSAEACKVCQEQRDAYKKLMYDGIAVNHDLCDALSRSQEVVSAAQDFRKVLQGTMSLLGPTGVKFCAALDKYAAELNKPGEYK